MRTMTATEVKNKLGDALSFSDDESLLIEKNGKDAYMVFSVPTARTLILTSYSNGGISRSTAMKLLGFVWYGQMLDALTDANIEAPSLPERELDAMVANAKSLLENI